MLGLSLSGLGSWDDVSLILDRLSDAVFEFEKIVGLSSTKTCVSQLFLGDADFALLRTNLDLIGNRSLAALVAYFEWHPDFEFNLDKLVQMTTRHDFPKASTTR